MTIFLTILSLIAFAANSLLARLALAEGTIDPLSFTAFRLFGGMLVLVPISRILFHEKPQAKQKRVWISGLALFGYALAFSFGYVTISAGTGTLILVGAVQVSMLGWALFRGEQINLFKWMGMLIALAGLVYLLSPGMAAPDPAGAALMLVSGTAWGIYSIRGRGAKSPISMTATNFTYASLLVLIVVAVGFQSLEISHRGVWIALLSGGFTSGLGYVIWYRALRNLSTTTASIAQLLIPVLAAIGGILFLGEHLSQRLIIASALILGGVGLSIVKKR
ncbi:DMT family transporter [Pontiellaceae bacterium B1224]|nr:DMT family transporter [Pontiellaceae bacterium B1224]